MTEAEWLQESDPEFLLDHLEGHASARKLRLLALACCQRVEHLLTDERSRASIATVEVFVNGQASPAEREAAFARAQAVIEDQFDPTTAEPDATWVACVVAQPSALQAARDCTTNVPYILSADDETITDSEFRQVVSLVRDIFGNPFRPISLLDPAWLKWDDATVTRLTHRIYDERRFEDMPILADALEEAGCTRVDILEHCRGPGPHVRGCWVVDRILGKE